MDKNLEMFLRLNLWIYAHVEYVFKLICLEIEYRYKITKCYIEFFIDISKEYWRYYIAK